MKTSQKLTRASIVLVLMGAAALAFVNSLPAQQAAPTKPAEPKYTEIKYSADSSSYKWEGDNRILALSGNVKFQHGDTVLLADKMDYQEKTKSATASGNLKIYDDRDTITGDLCSIDFNTKKVSITGAVRMTVKPKPKTTTDKGSKLTSELKDEAVITCAQIDYLYKDKKALIPSAVTIVQKTRTVTADSATYDGKTEVVQLTGNVKGNDEKDKHTFSAPKVTMSIKENDEWIQAEKATGSFYVKEEETK